MKLVCLLVSLAAASNATPRAAKLAQVLDLEQRRSAGNGELARYLADGDAGVRRRAALAAGRVADPTLTDALAALLRDGQVEVRQMAAFGLGVARDPRAGAALRTALADADPVVRARAAEALGRLGDPTAAEDVARMLLLALPRSSGPITVRGDDPGSATDPWLELRLGLFALAALGDARVAEGVLVNDGRSRFDWWAASYAAARLRSPLLRPVYLAATRASDPLSRAYGAQGLGAIRSAEDLTVLTGLTRDPDEGVVAFALRALGEIGDARACPVVVSVLSAGNTSLAVKQEALAALARLPLDRGQRELLVPYVGHTDPALRAAALAALARQDPERLALVLSGSDPDPVWFVRAALVRALGAADGDFALGLVFAALRDSDARVLSAALDALRSLKGSDAIDTLRKHLQHGDVAVRAAAAAALVALKAPGPGAAVGDAYQRSLGDPDCAARAQLVAALAADRGDAANTALQLAVSRDACPAVRERAAEALAIRGGAAPRQPYLGPRPSVDDRLAIAPFAPVGGLPLFTPRAFVHTPRGVIEMHLNVVDAPFACASFSWLARRGFYNGLIIDDVRPGAAVWGGAPRGDSVGGPGFVLRSEISDQPFGRGAVGLVRPAGMRDMEGSRFIITLVPDAEMDGSTTLLGWVVSGMDVVGRLRPGDAIERIQIWDGR